jgi:hypothetical protein
MQTTGTVNRGSLSDQLLNLRLIIALGNEAQMRECDPPLMID